MPDWLVNTMAVGLPPIELGIGIWLLVGLFTRFSAVVASILNIVFMAGMACIGTVPSVDATYGGGFLFKWNAHHPGAG